MPTLGLPSDRPPAYEPNSYGWNLWRVPETTAIDGIPKPHPGRHCAVFVVHGMGEQQWTQTSAGLRSGFEDALELIRSWQRKNLEAGKVAAEQVPPPFTYEGYWANYTDLGKTFPEDWEKFGEQEREFFQNLWNTRAYSAGRTYFWLLGQQLRLFFDPRLIRRIRLLVWLLYWPLQIVFPAALTVALLRAPRILTRILADVRLYATPRGMIEHAIVQRIDYRVGREFLRLIGLNWDFRPLPEEERVSGSGQRVVFDRVVWVAHSLGTVVSYNVLSDLFRRAGQLEGSGDDAQKQGVCKFRNSLCRFVTMGSPLNKFAVLFPNALRPWHTHDRPALLVGGDKTTGCPAGKADDKESGAREWWINFYHVLDPVSGALYDPLICGATMPVNIHTNWRSAALVPGVAHTSYWNAMRVSRFILARTYGRAYLPDQGVERQSLEQQTWFAIVGYLVWAVLMFGGIVCLFIFRADILRALWTALKSITRFLIGA